MTARYRDNVLEAVKSLLPGSLETGLDVGSGDGFFAARLMRGGHIRHVTAVDVKIRERCDVVPTLYDGTTLPFADRSFDVVYAVDMLHHTDDPFATLRELLRCP
jgi:SAM-dependent methyltransferase